MTAWGWISNRAYPGRRKRGGGERTRPTRATGGSPPQVLLRFQPTSADLGEFQVETVESSPSRFTARGSYLTIAGDWRVKVILRRAGANDVTHDFTVQVQDNPYLTDIVNPIPSTGNSIGAGKTLYESDCLACHGAQGKGDGPARAGSAPPAGGPDHPHCAGCASRWTAI